ncbi:MAG: flagellar hook-associated protein FlgK [Lachnospiraceae bacterium]|nr:flagellar hook-associated protein FlgK [Lachnospiraceae bacterium]
MPSQFFGLNTSYTGLLAANAGLNTTANNISNSETKGYSRQQAVQEANRALRTYTTYGSAGAGVDTIAIERIRDEFYDSKYWDNNTRLGDSDIKAYYTKSIENYLQDTDKIAGFNTAYNLMFDALEELHKNSGDAASKSQFVMYAQSLCDYFNSVSGQLSELQKDVNTEIKDTISQINSIAERIATLNKQINVIELTGARANELRDKRALLIDDLSQYVSVKTTEQPIKDTANNLDTGATRFIVEISGNQLLVDNIDYRTLSCQAREIHETVNQSDVQGLYEINWSDEIPFNLYNTMIGGKLQGLIELRDGNNTENFRGKIEEVKVAEGTVKIKADLDYLQDLDKCTLSAHGGRISLGSEVYYYSDWTYELDQNTGDCYYTFQLDLNYGDCILSPSREGKDAEIGASIDYQGIPYYQEQLNEFVRLFARTFNEILTQNGEYRPDTGEMGAVDGYGNPANDPTQNALFRGKTVDGELDFTDYYDSLYDADPILTVSNKSSSYYNLTAANFSINHDIAMDPILLATRTGDSEGESKADIVTKLLTIKIDKDVFSFRGGSSSEFLQSVLSDAALNAARANSSVKYYNTMNNVINNQRISVFGVDSDEEAVSLVKYRNAYNLASKMIQTFTEIYDRLILETGV